MHHALGTPFESACVRQQWQLLELEAIVAVEAWQVVEVLQHVRTF